MQDFDNKSFKFVLNIVMFFCIIKYDVASAVNSALLPKTNYTGADCKVIKVKLKQGSSFFGRFGTEVCCKTNLKVRS